MSALRELKVYQLDEDTKYNQMWVVADQAGWLPGVFETVDEAVAAWKKANDIE